MKGTVLFTKKNPLGIYGFIKNAENENYYFDTSCIVKGNYIHKGSMVTFDAEKLSNGKTKAVNVTLFEYKKMDDTQKQKVEEILVSKLNEKEAIDCAVIPHLLNSIGIDYKEYSEELSTFFQNEFAGVFVIRKKVEVDGKIYQAALVKFDTTNIMSYEKEKEILEKLLDEISRNGYIQCSILPQILNELGVNYKSYSSSVTQFVETYLTKYFVLKRNVPMNGKILPSILVPIDSEIAEDELHEDMPETSTGIEPSFIETLRNYFSEGQYYEFFRSKEFLGRTPDQLGADGVLLAIQAVAGYLGDTVQISLNEFQRLLIETERASDLTPFRDKEDILQQGMYSSFVPVTLDTFKAHFADLYHGKNNLNNNWGALVERFWCVKNDLSFYLNSIWLIILGKEKCVDFYIEEGVKSKNLSRLADLLYIWKSFSKSDYFIIPLRLKRKILGNCLDCDNIETLCKTIEVFDDVTMPEAKQLPMYLSGNAEIDGDILANFFHSDIEALVSEKLVNYFWYRQNSREDISDDIIKALSSVCWEYDESYIEVILYNNTYADFNVAKKAKILLQAFPYICKFAEKYKKAYLLANYIYVHIVDTFAYVTDVPQEQYDTSWGTLKQWMISQIKSQLSNDNRTTVLLAIFKYDDATMHELEEEYCEQFIKPALDECFDDEEFDELLAQYEEENVQFISQWIANNYRQASVQSVENLINEQKFSEAIRWIQTQNSLGVEQKKVNLRKVIFENFKSKGFNDSAYDIYSHSIPVAFAEATLLDGITANEDDAIAALFATYVYQKDWLKIAYMYAPYSATRNSMHPKLYENVKKFLNDNGIEAHKFAVSHFDVIKTAIRVLSNEEFDAFIKWAKQIQIPYGSKLYELKPKSFDAVFKSMLSGTEYSECWDQLLIQVLRSDNAEQQDMLRYSIIISYIGRYGAGKFERIISTILKWKGSGKDFFGYYTSIWKGLFAGKYSCNVLSLNLPLIKEAPITYWNLFYDIAVCKSHVFALNSLWGTQWHNAVYDMQGFYSSLVERYSESREPIFLQIAVELLEQYSETVITEFDKYLPYCNSNKSKDFLLQAIINLLRKKKYFEDIGEFLHSGYWFFTESERKLSFVLEQICDDDYEKFNENLELNLDEYWHDRFVSDFLSVFVEYPKFDIISVIQDGDSSEQYRFGLIKHVFQISYVQLQLVTLQNTGLVSAPQLSDDKNEIVRSYLEMMDLCYRRQLQTNTAPNLVWVQNRYHRILAVGMLLGQDMVDFDDEDIVSLMQNNKHFSDVYSNYKGFKDMVKSFVKSETLSDYLRRVVLLSVVSNEWGEFIDHIEEYDLNDLARVNSMMQLSNYRELNMQLFERYLLVKQGSYSDCDVKRIDAYSSKVGYVLGELLEIRKNDLGKYEFIVALLTGICRLKQQNRPSLSYDKLDYSLLKNEEIIHANWDLFMAALWSTNYETTIIFMFGDDIRNVKKRCTFQKIQLWKPVFQSISQMSVYYYLISVWYAIDRKRDEAKAAYEKVVAKNEIPAQWSQERNDLEVYLDARSNRFFAGNKKYVSTLSAETEARNLDFIADAVGTTVVSSEDAVFAYRTILGNSNRTTQLNAYKKLFGFVCNADNLYEIFRQIDTKKEKFARKTYNELVIAFGELLIVEDCETFSHDQKYLILSSIMDVYELLSDLNKEKIYIRNQLKAAESFVLGTYGLSMSMWLDNFERIKKIMQHPAIGNPTNLITDLCIPVEQCVHQIKKCETQMQVLDWLANWRSNWNVASNCSDYERAFVKAVDEELHRLKHGINLKLVVLNDNDMIEDGSIFYQIENMAGRSNTSVVLSNTTGINSAELEVKIGINGGIPEVYDNSGFNSTVELRPGDVCGQAYKLHSSVLSKIVAGDRIEVTLNVVINGVTVCNNDKDNRIFGYDIEKGILTSDMVASATKYEIAVPAFSKMIKGFGRERERRMIREYLEQQLVIIYGPSRVGKSSLMNYINNEYVAEYHRYPENEELSIVTISIADDRNKNDYLTSMENGLEDIADYNARQMMDYLFTAPIRVAFDSHNPLRQNRRKKLIGREFPEDVQTTILKTLTYPGTIRDKYTAISQVLEENNCQIWLLYDEFQQVIERWDGVAAELAELCSEIKYNMSGIKLVICGSDDLLRLFECENDPKWNEFKIRTAENSVPVGQLEDSDFVEMMEDKRIWTKLEDAKPFSEAALKLLHRYTGGNAICGKIFGNEILNNLRMGIYQNRRKIYPSDVTQIAYGLLSSEVGLVKNQLVVHNTKNLENEMKYLLFIANEFATDSNRADVSYRKIREFFESRSTAEIDLALKILVARGILKTGVDKKRYSFTTMFYFDFFRGEASETRLQEIYDAEHRGQIIDHTPWIDQITDILKRQPKVTTGNMLDIINSLNDPDIKAGVGKQYSDATTTINTKTYVGENTGSITDTQNIIQINAQTINTALNTLLTGASDPVAFLEAFKNMPTLATYLSEGQKAELVSLTDELSECETLEDAMDTEVRIEELTAPVEQRMLSDTVGAVVASDDFIDVSDDRWIELLGIHRQDELDRIRKLPTEFVTPLGFAVMLHNVFDRISQKMQAETTCINARELDFCPVAIMYCKVVEAVLKKLHTPIYIDKIGDATVKFGGIQFRDLLDTDGVTILPSKDLTIGSFAFNIVSTDRHNDVDEPDQFKASPKKSMIKRLTSVTDYSASVNQDWFSHAKDLAVIQAIRNKSAHEAAPISKSNFEWLIRVLFGDSELLRIAELAIEQ